MHLGIIASELHLSEESTADTSILHKNFEYNDLHSLQNSKFHAITSKSKSALIIFIYC